MDHSWCPVCDNHIFAVENLYCSEFCRQKDAQPSSSSPSIITKPSIYDYTKDSFYEFPRCSRKPHQSPYSTPGSSPYTSPLLTHSRTSSSSSYFDPKEDEYYSSSPSNYLYSSEDDLSMSLPPANFPSESFFNAAPITNPALSMFNTITTTTSDSSKPLRKKRSLTDNIRRLFFF
ncbi:713_t:CDS:1 [Ambispora gerdemannii]|uniref:713_t:CDS:1 n=1 Tax=Ambispora gerdemannii TaxID=144530 RepID=A0A9N8VJ25_9GLOM|nr:713_t:CDS:1 [Ambispora gerdemannii]